MERGAAVGALIDGDVGQRKAARREIVEAVRSGPASGRDVAVASAGRGMVGIEFPSVLECLLRLVQRVGMDVPEWASPSRHAHRPRHIDVTAGVDLDARFGCAGRGAVAVDEGERRSEAVRRGRRSGAGSVCERRWSRPARFLPPKEQHPRQRVRPIASYALGAPQLSVPPIPTEYPEVGGHKRHGHEPGGVKRGAAARGPHTVRAPRMGCGWTASDHAPGDDHVQHSPVSR